jgi:hypothetical protein
VEKDWIKFDRAVALLEKRYGSLEEALSALHEMLIIGDVRSLAGEITRYENSPVLGVGGTVTRRRSKRPIPAKLWKRISLWDLHGSDWRQSSFWATCLYMHWGLRSKGGKNEIRHISYRLRFVDVDQQGLAHLVEDPAGQNAVSLSSAGLAAERWLDERFREPTTVNTSKKDFAAQAQAEISGLSGRGFEAAWRSVVIRFPDRAKAGRKSNPAP